MFFLICRITVYAQTSFEAIYNRILSCFQLTFLLSPHISTSVMLQGRCCTHLKNKGAVCLSFVAKCLDFKFYLELTFSAWNWGFLLYCIMGFILVCFQVLPLATHLRMMPHLSLKKKMLLRCYFYFIWINFLSCTFYSVLHDSVHGLM